MKVYHGTIFSSAMNIMAQGVKLNYSQKMLDFGKGFYTTPDKKHAISTAKHKAFRHNQKYRKDAMEREVPAVVTLEYIEDEGLSIKAFESHDQEWKNFILANRSTDTIVEKYGIIEHNLDNRYDIVKGEIADGSIAQKAVQVRNEGCTYWEIDVKDLLVEGEDAYGYQISFHTEKSLHCIKPRRCDIIFK